MTQRDYYQVLGVTREASHADIRAAFVRLSRLHHPDVADSDHLPWRVQDVRQAYHCLSDATLRAAHDRALAETLRLHLAQQRTVQRRLHRYDRRHPHPVPRPYHRNGWWALLAVGILAGLVVAAFRLID